MSKAKSATEAGDGDLRPEYGASTIAEGVRGKYHRAYSAGSNLAKLAPDVRAAFPSDDEVNQALRLLIKLAQQNVHSGTR